MLGDARRSICNGGICFSNYSVILMIFEIADQYLLETSKAVAYVDDLTAASIIKEIKHWWEAS